MSFGEMCQFLDEIGRSSVIQLVIALATIWAVLVAARSVKIAAKANKQAALVGEESVRIAKLNTEYNSAMMAQSDRHQRMSVRPLITRFDRFNFTDDAVTFSVGIKNSGVGPALIRSIKFFFNSEEITASDGDLSNLPSKLFLLCIAGSGLRYRIKLSGSVGVSGAVIPGQEVVFLEVFFPCEQEVGTQLVKLSAEDLKRRIDKLADPAAFRVEYTSIYRDEDFEPVDSRE